MLLQGFQNVPYYAPRGKNRMEREAPDDGHALNFVLRDASTLGPPYPRLETKGSIWPWLLTTPLSQTLLPEPLLYHPFK